MKKILRFIFNVQPMPDSLTVRVEREMKGVPINKEIQERMLTLLRDAEVNYFRMRRYNMGALLFLMLMVISVAFDLWILWIGSIMAFLWLWAGATNMREIQERRWGFVDGIQFVLVHIGKTVEDALNDGSIPQGIIDELKKMQEEKKTQDSVVE